MLRGEVTLLAALIWDLATARGSSDGVLVDRALVESVLVAHLAATRREPDGLSADELIDLVAQMLSGLSLRLDAGHVVDLQTQASATLRALEAWTRLTDRPDAVREQIEPVVRGLADQLRDVPLRSSQGLQIAAELLALAPSSTTAFWIVRDALSPLLTQAGEPSAPVERALWVKVALTFAMADGNRMLVERALEVERTIHPPATGIEALRSVWALLRLERFDDARALSEQITRVPDHPRDAAADSVAGALAAYRLWLTGDPDEAVATVEGLRRTNGFGFGFGRGVGALALVELGRPSEAHEMLSAVPFRSPPDLGTTMLLIARGTLAVAEGRSTSGVEDLLAARDGLRRVGNRNPSGWPWLAPSVTGLRQLGQSQQAARLLDEQEPDVPLRGTPLLLRQFDLARRAGGPTSPTGTDPSTALTPRVAEVAALLSAGLRDREIAERLHLSTRTVHRHVATALKQTGARNRTELALYLHRTEI